MLLVYSHQFIVLNVEDTNITLTELILQMYWIWEMSGNPKQAQYLNQNADFLLLEYTLCKVLAYLSRTTTAAT